MFEANEEVLIECPVDELQYVHLSAKSFSSFPDKHVANGMFRCRAWINSSESGQFYRILDYAGYGPAISVVSTLNTRSANRMSWYVLERWFSPANMTYQRRAFWMFREKLDARVQRSGAGRVEQPSTPYTRLSF